MAPGSRRWESIVPGRCPLRNLDDFLRVSHRDTAGEFSSLFRSMLLFSQSNNSLWPLWRVRISSDVIWFGTAGGRRSLA